MNQATAEPMTKDHLPTATTSTSNSTPTSIKLTPYARRLLADFDTPRLTPTALELVREVSSARAVSAALSARGLEVEG